MSLVHGAPVPGNRSASRRRLFLRFAIGADAYVLQAEDILQVQPLARYKQVPGAPVYVAGLALYRAKPLPVIDMTALALGRPAARLNSTRMVVVDSPAGGDEHAPLGLILEKATETVHYDPGAFLPSGLDHTEAPYLGPILETEGVLVQWVGVENLIPHEIRVQLFGAAREAQA